MRNRTRIFFIIFVYQIIFYCFALSFSYGQSLIHNTATKQNYSIHDLVVKRLQGAVQEWLDKDSDPVLAIAVVDDKGILWSTTSGFTNRDKKIRITNETLFSIQSMSKSMTTMAILMAVQDGLLSLDEPIVTYIPNFTVNSRFEEFPQKKITLRHLLSHKGGFTHEAPIGNNYDSRPHTFEEHIKSISKTWLRYPVGYRYSYPNLGFDLAGYILQLKSGLPFWKYIEEKIFHPLGMKKSSFNMKKIKTEKNRAIGNLIQDNEVPEEIPLEIPMIPAGGCYSNILDMANYLQFIINNGHASGKQLLRNDLMEDMLSIALPYKSQRTGYGLGINIEVLSNTYSLFHGGSGYGFSSAMVIYPELKLGIVALTNNANFSINHFKIRNLVDPIIEDKFGETKPLPGSLATTSFTSIDSTDKRIQKIIGDYYNASIFYDQNELKIKLGLDNYYPLKMYMDNKELLGRFGIYSEIRFLQSFNGNPGTILRSNLKYNNCIYYDFHHPLNADDIPGPNKPEWEKFTGTYEFFSWGRIKEGEFNISIKYGYLYINRTRCIEYLPGLFFAFDGETLDFTGEIPSYANIPLYKIE